MPTAWPGQKPIAWAAHRQELCETLPYFRAYHGGIHAKSAAPTGSTSLGKRLRASLSGSPAQSSSPHRDATTFAYLLGGFGAPRDVWACNGRVIISHGGGKSGAVKEVDDDEQDDPLDEGSESAATPQSDIKSKQKTRFALQGSQSSSDHRTAGLLQARDNSTPVVLIASKDYALSHGDLGPYFAHDECNFVVLGWYWVSHAWMESEGLPMANTVDSSINYIVPKRWKFRFQYVERQGSPWWLLKAHRVESRAREFDLNVAVGPERHIGSNTESRRSPQGPTVLRAFGAKQSQYMETHLVYCRDCKQASPLIYEQSSICLNEDCACFWKLAVSNACAIDQFVYKPSFLCRYTEPDLLRAVDVPFAVGPEGNQRLRHGPHGSLMGLHCQQCHRLSCRIRPDHWQCEHCHLVERAPAKSLPAGLSSRSPGMLFARIEEECVLHAASGISSAVRCTSRWRILTFSFPIGLGGGKVHIMQSGREAKAFCDSLLADICQGTDANPESEDATRSASTKSTPIPFRRHALSSHRGTGRLLSQQFTSNYGAPYKHIVKMNTTPLQEGPPAVQDVLHFIKRATRLALIGQDGEIANQQDTQKDFNELYPVLYFSSQSMHYHDDGEPGLGPVISSLSLGGKAKMHFRLKAKYTSDHPTRARGSLDTANFITAPPPETSGQREAADGVRIQSSIPMASRRLLSIPLSHGCIIVQEGHGIQTHLEHAIEPDGAIRSLARDRFDRSIVINEDAFSSLQVGQPSPYGMRLGMTARRIDQVPAGPKKMPRSTKEAKSKPQPAAGTRDTTAVLVETPAARRSPSDGKTVERVVTKSPSPKVRRIRVERSMFPVKAPPQGWAGDRLFNPPSSPAK